MKLIDIIEEGVGRIVKDVNTTPDVGVNQTSIEAAKFGFKVDKDGRPPQLSKKTKGSKTNTLFNLGLTEGIKLKLERDNDIDVLHIQDTNEKSHVEVRGKKGYETDGYDPDDKLHQVLDRVGKAANISELMNGDVVHINPKHPQGTRAIRTARDVLQTENTFTELEETYEDDDFYDAYGVMWYNEDDELDEAEYQGRKVKLGKPMRGDVKKFKVYVKNPKGNVVKVNFGSKEMRIKKSNPARRRSFRARHNCDNPGPRHKARYWSCRKW